MHYQRAGGANANTNNPLRISQSEIDMDDIISDLHSEASSVQHNPVHSSAQKRTAEQKKVTQQLMQKNNKTKDVKSKIDTGLNVRGQRMAGTAKPNVSSKSTSLY